MIKLYFSPLLLGCVMSFSSNAQILSQGPFSGGTFSNDNSVGVLPFTNVGNAASSDNARATANALVVLSTPTHYLKVTNFGFNVPPQSVISGIEIAVEKRGGDISNIVLGVSLTGSIKDNSVRLTHKDSIFGANKAKTTDWTASDNISVYGGAGDSWSAILTPGIVNDPSFGIVFSASIEGELVSILGLGLVSLLPSAGIDHISATVHYTTPTLLNNENISLTGRYEPNQCFSELIWEVSGEEAEYAVYSSENNTDWELESVIRASNTSDYLNWTYTGCCPNRYFRVQRENEYDKSVSNTVKLFCEEVTSLIEIFPNPAWDVITITSLDISKSPRVKYVIMNSLGSIVKQGEEFVAKDRIRISVEDLISGKYFLCIADTDGNMLAYRHIAKY